MIEDLTLGDFIYFHFMTMCILSAFTILISYLAFIITIGLWTIIIIISFTLNKIAHSPKKQ